jgi:hypothetical protein
LGLKRIKIRVCGKSGELKWKRKFEKLRLKKPRPKCQGEELKQRTKQFLEFGERNLECKALFF